MRKIDWSAANGNLEYKHPTEERDVKRVGCWCRPTVVLWGWLEH